MALRSTLSILGLWQFNNDIFSGLVLPEEMDKDTVINEILSQCAEFELVYPSYEVMEGLIANWSKIELPIWKRVYRDCTIEYNPIWNKDGMIVELEDRDLMLDKTGTGTTKNKTQPITNTNTEQTTGYNSGTWENSSRNTTDLGMVDSELTDTPDYHDHDHGKIIRGKIEQGNIGVTKTTELLSDDLALLPQLNPYQFIVNSFKKKFCLLIY